MSGAVDRAAAMKVVRAMEARVAAAGEANLLAELKAGAIVFERPDELLLEAVYQGAYNVVRLLLAAGVANAAASDNEALLLATAAGWPGMVRLLLDYGADPRPRAAQLLGVAKYAEFVEIQALLEAALAGESVS